jgi:triphosphoribosyl-dephospho-CoA synthase
MRALTENEIESLFLAACRAELQALKPGNVHVHAAGHGMERAQFEAAAAAAAPHIAKDGASVGVRILGAVEASMAAAGCNTNLGIVLLSAPLAAAAEATEEDGLRARLARVLAALGPDDAANVYEAIRMASPGGLGSAPEQDVAAAPTVPLTEAMALAAGRDRIAQAYVSDFAEIFEFGLPALDAARLRGGDGPFLVTALHMAYLAQAPDSHIARKHGIDLAKTVQMEARALARHWDPKSGPDSFEALLAFDSALKQRNINPGTTADFVVATLFADAMCDRMGDRGPA